MSLCLTTKSYGSNISSQSIVGKLEHTGICSRATDSSATQHVETYHILVISVVISHWMVQNLYEDPLAEQQKVLNMK